MTTKKKNRTIFNNISNTTSKLTKGITTSVISLSTAVQNIVKLIGKSANNLSLDINIKLDSMIGSLGKFTNKSVKRLGKQIKKVPILGNGVATLVKGTERGVFYIVLTIKDASKIIGRTAGNLVNKSSKIIVVTLKSTNNIIDDLQDRSEKLLKNTASRLSKMTKKLSLKNKRSRSRSRSRSHSRHT